MTHELKTWPEYFEKVFTGEKTFEVRKNDRNFQVDDILVLKEWQPSGYSSVSPNELKGYYTGREVTATVTYLFQEKPESISLFGISSDTVVMSIRILPAPLPVESVPANLDNEFVSAAWTWLAKQGIDYTDREHGDCFKAIKVLRALQIAAKQ